MGTKTRTCFLIMALQMVNLISAQEVAKRVPQGFLGVRGKKYDSEELDHYYKRKPQFFVGVKGKKSLLDYLQSNYEQYYKRAPMGFVGMRGKKDSNESPDTFEYVPKRGSLIGQIDYSSNEYPSNGIDYPILNQLLAEYQNREESSTSVDSNEIKPSNESNNLQPYDFNEDHSPGAMTKRAAHVHQFFGVRGKKAGGNKRPFDMSFRGKFVGVRGKKDLKNSGVQEIKFLLDREGPWPKRKGQMNGFFGMRGKKWLDESNSSGADMQN